MYENVMASMEPIKMQSRVHEKIYIGCDEQQERIRGHVTGI